MTSLPPGRRSIHLAGYDYSSAGVYFVTICAFRRAMLFGEIRGAKMISNVLGGIIEATWSDLPNRLPSVALDAFAIMPNHLHGIVVLHRKKRAETSSAPTTDKPSVTLARVIQTFKSIARLRVKQQSGRAVPLWQRGYFEHIVRSGKALRAIQRYIWENPARWRFDRENPQAMLPSNLTAEPWEV
jgi:REP element-mobilizing transposase RayT